MIPKPLRTKDKKYLLFVKKLPCMLISHDCLGEVSYHHTTTQGAGGSDYLTVPLCGYHHDECHRIGRDTFQKKHNIDFKDEIIRLLSNYIAELKEG